PSTPFHSFDEYIESIQVNILGCYSSMLVEKADSVNLDNTKSGFHYIN
ncbi:24338_t:CDS:1, partial [Gigaspora rosea]